MISGRHPLNYYICRGNFPLKDLELPVKSRRFSISIFAISFLLNLIIFLKISNKKRKLVPLQQHQSNSKHSFISLIEKNTFGDVAMCIFAFLLLGGNAYGVVAFNSLLPPDVNVYPNNLYTYWFHHIVPMLGFVAFWVFICARKPSFRDFLKREMNDFFDNMVRLG